MSYGHDEDITIITLELPARLATRLEDLRQQFGDELVADSVCKAKAAVEGKLALRGDYKNRK